MDKILIFYNEMFIMKEILIRIYMTKLLTLGGQVGIFCILLVIFC